MKQVYRVGGMSCEHCAQSVAAAVKALGAEIEVNVDLASGTVVVDGVEDEKVLSEAIEGAGYEFGGRSLG